jgi:hypothetical protein
MLGRIRADLDEHLLLSLNDTMVLPHLHHCLMVSGATLKRAGMGGCGKTLLKLQKRLVGLKAGKGGQYHANPLFAVNGILKVGGPL